MDRAADQVAAAAPRSSCPGRAPGTDHGPLLPRRRPHHPRTAPHLGAERKGLTTFDGDLVLARRPDVILLRNGLLDDAGRVPMLASPRRMAAHPRFLAEFEQAVVPIPGSYPLVDWKRRGARGL